MKKFLTVTLRHPLYYQLEAKNEINLHQRKACNADCAMISCAILENI